MNFRFEKKSCIIRQAYSTSWLVVMSDDVLLIITHKPILRSQTFQSLLKYGINLKIVIDLELESQKMKRKNFNGT
ncbi:hypothetical protein Glove_541g39 [Diversispora epigaea]|uniref:Uncharacterized protein n=1 Tax=Diversispora epigaea TaxID=1348612 RepID=A0A397GHE4_9GLOM|nr:hypothetical protein Glove_541g39 [Diversispora epigaea]